MIPNSPPLHPPRNPMSKINVMELFARARSSGTSTPSSSFKIRGNEKIAVEATEFNLNINTSEKLDPELPEFISEPSTIATGGSRLCSTTDRLVAAAGQYVALARGKSVWLIDMSCGKTSEYPTSDMSKNDIKFIEMRLPYIAYTDGIDVGVLKINADDTGVRLSGSLYLGNAGSVDDPVKFIVFYPSGSLVATVRNVKGWTLWDIARMQLGGKSIESLDGMFPFKSIVENAASAPNEGTFAYTTGSQRVLAGKQLSPGVLAILKRGGDSTPENKKTSGPVSAFCFTADGRHAIAAVDGSVIRCWNIGKNGATVNEAPEIESGLKNLIAGKNVIGLVAIRNDSIGIVHMSGYIEVTLGGCTVIRSISADASLMAAFVVNGTTVFHVAPSHVMLIDESQVALIDLETQLDHVAVGGLVNGSQFNMYIVSEGTWLGHTIDMEVFREDDIPAEQEEFASRDTSPVASENPEIASAIDEIAEDSSDAEFTHSDVSERGPATVTPPDRQFSREPSVLVDFAHAKEQMLIELQADVARSIDTAMKSVSQKQNKQLTDAVKKIVKKQFSAGMSAFVKELEIQMERMIESKLKELMAITPAIQLESIMAQIDAISRKIESVDQADPSVDPEVASILAEIRRFLDSGDRVQAIATAAQWWKLNKQKPASSDVLAITCSAALDRLSPPEPIRDTSSGCYMLLVLTEWVKEFGGDVSLSEKTQNVLRATRYVVGSLMLSQTSSASSEVRDLCSRSLSKTIRNVASASLDSASESIVRELIGEVRELLLKFNTPTVPGSSRTSLTPDPRGSRLLQLLQQGSGASSQI
jgi:hypothetical protein